MAVPWRTDCHSATPLDRLFVDLPGKRSTWASGAEYLMMVVDDYSRLSWSYFFERKTDVPGIIARFLADGLLMRPRLTCNAPARTTARSSSILDSWACSVALGSAASTRPSALRSITA